MDWCGGDTDSLVNAAETTLECNYDKNVTNLYQAIEKAAWDSILMFLTTKKWSFMALTTDLQSPESQTRTWVTRFDPNGKVRWSQLPLHAAIIFRAPSNVVKALIDLYPLSVQCTDDQRMLPLHLAFRVGAKDAIMNLLIKCFPEALVTQNQCGLFPYEIIGRDVRKDFTESVKRVVKLVTQKVSTEEQQTSQEKTDDLEDAMEEQEKLVKELENDKIHLELELADAKTEIAVLKERCRMLERIITVGKDSKSAPAVTPTKNSTSGGFFQNLLTLGNNDDANSSVKSSPSRHSNTMLAQRSKKLVELVNTLDAADTEATDSECQSTTGSHSTNSKGSTRDSVKKDVVEQYRDPHFVPSKNRNTSLVVNNLGRTRTEATVAHSTETTLSHNSEDVEAKSANATSIHHLEKKDMCWNELKQKLYNGTEIASGFEAKGENASVTSSVNLNSVQQHKPYIIPFDDSHEIAPKKLMLANNLNPKDAGETVGNSTNVSVSPSENVNSIHHLEKQDMCWNELKQRIYNGTDNASRSETNDNAMEKEKNELVQHHKPYIVPYDDPHKISTRNIVVANNLNSKDEGATVSQDSEAAVASSVDTKAIQHQKPDMCWNELRQTIYNNANCASRFEENGKEKNSPIANRVNLNSVQHHKPHIIPYDDSHEISMRNQLMANSVEPNNAGETVGNSTNVSVTPSANANSIHHFEKQDVCWNELKQRIYNGTDNASRFESNAKEEKSLVASRVNLNSVQHHKPYVFPDDDSHEISTQKILVANNIDSKGAGETVASSVNVNSIHHLEKQDMCWNELKQRIYNGTEIASRFETKEANASVVSSVNLNSVQHQKEPYSPERSRKTVMVANNLEPKDKGLTVGSYDNYRRRMLAANSLEPNGTGATVDSRELYRRRMLEGNSLEPKDSVATVSGSTVATATSSVKLNPTSVGSSANHDSIQNYNAPDICWNEVRQTIRNSTDNIALQFRTQEKADSSKSDTILRESAGKLLSIIPKEKETRADIETTSRYSRTSRYSKESDLRKRLMKNSRWHDLTDPNMALPEDEEAYMI